MRALFALLALGLAYGILLAWPQLLLNHEVSAGNVVLHARAPLPSRALEPARSGSYLRYHLLVAHRLDRQGLTPEALLAEPPEPSRLESDLRAP